jgi:hypothetical protein
MTAAPATELISFAGAWDFRPGKIAGEPPCCARLVSGIFLPRKFHVEKVVFKTFFCGRSAVFLKAA